MVTHETIRTQRELRRLSQEEMAEKLNMSPSGYAKIERGETKLHLDKLEQIAHIFNMDIIELMQAGEKGVYFVMTENTHTNANYYGSSEALTIENEKLKLSLEYKDQIIQQKDNEIASLKEIIALLKNS